MHGCLTSMTKQSPTLVVVKSLFLNHGTVEVCDDERKTMNRGRLNASI